MRRPGSRTAIYGGRPDTDRVEAGIVRQRDPVWRGDIEHGQVPMPTSGVSASSVSVIPVAVLPWMPGLRQDAAWSAQGRQRSSHPVAASATGRIGSGRPLRAYQRVGRAGVR